MKATLLIVVLGFCLVGCKPPVEPTSNNTAPPFGLNKSAAGTTGTSAGTTGASENGIHSGTSGGVAPIASGAAGGMTPMTGTDSVEGAGAGSVGQSAKNLAKDKANKMSSGSLDQGGKDESGQ